MLPFHNRFTFIFVLLVSSLPSLTSTSVFEVSGKKLPDWCDNLRATVMNYCNAYAMPSKSLEPQLFHCCYFAKISQCLNDNHNETCPVPLGATRFNLSLQHNCSMLTDTRVCSTFFSSISSESVFFIGAVTFFIIIFITSYLCCYLVTRDDNSDLLPVCQLTDFKVSSKNDLRNSCNLTVETDEVDDDDFNSDTAKSNNQSNHDKETISTEPVDNSSST